MDNETLSDFIDQIIYDEYISTLQLYFSFGALAIFIYSSLLNLPDEIKYIWKLKFSFPVYLYLLAKYPLFIYLPLAIVIDLAPLTLRYLYLITSNPITSKTHVFASQCGIVGIIAQVIQIFSFIGIQDPIFNILTPIRSTAIIVSDTLAFAGIFRQVWGLWRLKRSLGLQNNDFLTSLLQQDLRRRNANKSAPNQLADLSLPILSFQENPVQSVRTVLGRLHESIVAEMGERNDLPAMDNHSHQAASRLPEAGSNRMDHLDEDQLGGVGHLVVLENNTDTV
ncbi:hypothetical protein Clacol_009376 [Clathrus columnatus]|uniref:DUF6533 domain-containing protein n=1 Tax=Clathrus columnatus TaxID=1419009 RepID=A0AAV5AQD4_9AGAM|nr:hypothetical protein Clacol_009376 [Clathrus columnatus]